MPGDMQYEYTISEWTMGRKEGWSETIWSRNFAKAKRHAIRSRRHETSMLVVESPGERVSVHTDGVWRDYWSEGSFEGRT